MVGIVGPFFEIGRLLGISAGTDTLFVVLPTRSDQRNEVILFGLFGTILNSERSCGLKYECKIFVSSLSDK